MWGEAASEVSEDVERVKSPVTIPGAQETLYMRRVLVRRLPLQT